MKLAFVIIHYNDFESTRTLLTTIQSYACLDLIVVVDNCSTDDSYKRLKKFENKKINVIQTKENKGFAAGLNFGSRYAIEKLGPCNLVLSNADILLGEEADVKALHKVLSKKEIGVVAPVIVENQTISRGWHLPSVKTEVLGNLPVFGKKIYQKRISYPESHYQEKISYVDAVSGCFFFISSKALSEIGFFDEETFLYYEEYILAEKLKQAKYKVAVLNEVAVIHNHSVSVDKSMNRIKKFKCLKESQAYFCKTYLHAKPLSLFFLSAFKNLTLSLLYLRCFFKVK